LQKKKLSIAIPASIVSDVPHLREKTSKIGLVGRTAAIFNVSEIIVYPDNLKISQKRETDLIAALLSYMETPQYLRKRLFTIKPELQYAGILPPLRTPHHPLNRKTKNLKTGEYREGAVASKTNEGTLIDIGVEQPALISGKQLPTNKRVTVKITDISGQIKAEITDRDTIPTYWGYTVTAEKNPIGKTLKNRSFDLTIATSKFGTPFTDVADEVGDRWGKAKTVLLAFGAPTQGLKEIAGHEGLRLEDIADFVVNTIPAQGTETVRTEEALLASLAIINTYFRL